MCMFNFGRRKLDDDDDDEGFSHSCRTCAGYC